MKKYLIILILLFILPFTVLADSYLTDSVAGSETTTLKTFLSIDDTISVINFESVDNINITGVDLSKDGDNSVIANVDYDNDLLTIQFKGKLVFPEDSSYLFYYFDAVKEINGLEYFDFRQTITLLSFFDNCSSVTAFDVSEWDTSNIKKFNGLFNKCESLLSADLSNFNTSDAINMRCLFQFCSSIEYINLDGFDTHNVTDFSFMFNGCIKLKDIDVSFLDTSSVTKINSMFSQCKSLKKIDLFNFNVSQVTNFSYVFLNCISLKSIDLSSFDTKNADNMYAMFTNCQELEAIYVSDKWDTSGVTSSNLMFGSDTKLKNFDSSALDKTNAHTGEGGYLTLAPTVTIKDNSSLFGNIIKVTKNIFSNVKELFSSNNDWDHNDNDIINTGDTVSIMSGDNIFRTYIISFNGDTNGDGKINYIDYVRVYNHINNKKKLNKSYLISADYNNDNIVNSNDYSKIYNDIKK